MSSTPEPQPDAQASAASEPPAAPELDEYLTSGRRFLRWNLVTLILGLVALTIGLLVVKQQRAAKGAPDVPSDRQGADDAKPH